MTMAHIRNRRYHPACAGELEHMATAQILPASSPAPSANRVRPPHAQCGRPASIRGVDRPAAVAAKLVRKAQHQPLGRACPGCLTGVLQHLPPGIVGHMGVDECLRRLLTLLSAASRTSSCCCVSPSWKSDSSVRKPDAVVAVAWAASGIGSAAPGVAAISRRPVIVADQAGQETTLLWLWLLRRTADAALATTPSRSVLLTMPVMRPSSAPERV